MEDYRRRASCSWNTPASLGCDISDNRLERNARRWNAGEARKLESDAKGRKRSCQKDKDSLARSALDPVGVRSATRAGCQSSGKQPYLISPHTTCTFDRNPSGIGWV